MAQAVVFLTCIREVAGSNVGWDTDYTDRGFSDFPQSI
jgi:hypothetical protein